MAFDAKKAERVIRFIEYGNSVAVPCVFFVLAGIAWAAGKEQSE